MLNVSGLSKHYAAHQALAEVSFELADGEILVVLGPSGSGKSTLLKLIAGLEEPDAGEVRWDGKLMNSVPVHQRGFGYMFQDYALFPHRDVAGNVAFGLEMAGLDKVQIESRVAEVLELVGLADFGAREISGLSGGEQQRVALARALAPKPQLLMLDEPLGSLDRALREDLGEALHSILKAAKQSSLYVTHDQEEAFRLGDRILLLDQGKLVQIGSPQELYYRPATRFAAEFMGYDNLLSASIRKNKTGYIAQTELGDFAIAEEHAEDAATLLLRPDRISIGGKQGRAAVLEAIAFRGRYWELDFDLSGQPVRVEISGNLPDLEIGKTYQLSIPPEALQVLPNG